MLASAASLLTQTGPEHLVLSLAVNVRVRSITPTPRRATGVVVLYTPSGTPLYSVTTDATVRPGGVRFPPPRHSTVNADLPGATARRLLKEGGLLILTVDTDRPSPRSLNEAASRARPFLDRALALPGGGAGSLGHAVFVRLTPR